MKKPPRTRVQGEDLSEFLNDVLRDTRRAYLEEFGDERRAIKGAKLNAVLKDMVGWMRVGFVQARRRYYYANTHDIEYLFVQLAKATEKVRGEYGDKLIVTVNPKKLTFRIEHQTPYDNEYDY